MGLCKKCVIPLEESFAKFVPQTALPIRTDKGMCNSCYSLENDPFFERYGQKDNIFVEELEQFLEKRKKIVFAYSGGLDSTVVLNLLNKECRNRNIDLALFTIDHGFKGEITMANIESIIRFEGLESQHRLIDITNEANADGHRNFDIYANCYRGGVLPCGKTCNRIIDSAYRKILDKEQDNILITGGDTPKFNKSLNRFSIFWEKPEFIVLRGGVAFGLGKTKNREYVKKNNIPWIDPGCGGYDTDCLLPGAILKNMTAGKFHNFETVVKDTPVVLEYFSERVRWGIIGREEAISRMNKLEVSDDFSYAEINKLTSQ